MKFAQEFNQELTKDEFPYDYPKHWISSAISYKNLKKCINKVSVELSSLGFDINTLSSLLETATADREQILKYSLGENTSNVHPKLSLVFESENGVPVDARLSDETVRFLKRTRRIASEEIEELPENDNANQQVQLNGDDGNLARPEPPLRRITTSKSKNEADSSAPNFKRVEIELHADTEFFEMLMGQIFELDELQNEEENKMKEQIASISDAIVKAGRSRSQSGLYSWREILDLYIQAGIFFASIEADRGQRSPAKAFSQMNWFDAQLEKVQGRSNKVFFRSKPVQQFFQLNKVLLRNMYFQQINHTAMTKILKKFSKKTALPAKKEFPALITTQQRFLSTTMSKAICFTITSEILGLVPILDDYSCSICSSIAYRPVRLSCSHWLCSGCTLKLQRANTNSCPFCRQPVITEANALSVDPARQNFLEKFFSREVKVKKEENARAAHPALYGIRS